MRTQAHHLALLATLALACTSRAPVPATPILTLTLVHHLGDSTTFTAPQYTALAPTGAFAIADSRDLCIRVFDTAGRQTAEIGGRGQAPGEFLSIGGVEWREGSFWASDGTQLRLTYFAPTGRLLRTSSFTPPAPPGPGVRWLAPIGHIADTLEVLGYSQAAHATTLPPPLLLTINGRPVDSVRLPAQAALFLNVDLPGDLHLSTVQPFRGANHTLGAGSSGLLLADEPTPGSVRLAILRSERETLATRMLRVPPVPLSSATVERWIDQAFGVQSPVPKAILAESLRVHVARPQYLPSATRLYLGADRQMWVRGADSLAGPVPWHRIDASGIVGVVILNPGDQLLWARGDSVLLGLDTETGPQVGLFRVQINAPAR